MTIQEVLRCPECGGAVTDALVCVSCGHAYIHKYGVYNMVSENISEGQTILWRFTDEMIESDPAEETEYESQTWAADYNARKNKKTLDAERKHHLAMNQIVRSFSGVICDLATGLGGMLGKLLGAGRDDLTIVCTDIDPRVLAMTRKNRQTDDARVFYVASDGRQMSVKDQSFDVITSLAGFGNIPENDRVAKELYRLLKPGGRLVVQGSYIQKDSKSYELAQSLGLERGMVEAYLLDDLKAAGFEKVVSTIVAEAVWAENPYDLLPVAGDLQRYCIIEAVRA
jgi:ubiquinone/menaquinone biosynthesis C-methylase UbiE